MTSENNALISLKDLRAMDDRYFSKQDALILTRKSISTLGIPNAIAQDYEILMMKLFAMTKKVGGKVVHIGRIIFTKIAQFIGEVSRFITSNAKVIIGTIIGAVLGSFLSFIPFIGQIFTLVGAFFGFYKSASFEDMRKVSKEFYELLQSFCTKVKEIFIAIKDTIQE